MDAYDGTIKIDTRLDTKGFNEGVKQIGASMNKVVDFIKGIGVAWLAVIAGGMVFNSLLAGLSNYNLMWSSMGKEIWDLNWAFQTLQGAWANLLATAIQPMIPYVIQIIHWLTGLLQYITVIIAALFGMSQTVGNITKKTDMLASFDKINKLGQIGPATTPPPLDVPPDLAKKINDLKQSIMETWQNIAKWFMDNVWNPLVNYWTAISPMLATIWGNIVGFFRDNMGTIMSLWNNGWAFIWDIVRFYFALIGGAIKLGLDLLTGNGAQFQKDWNQLWIDLSNIMGDAISHGIGFIGSYLTLGIAMWSSLFKVFGGVVQAVFVGIGYFVKGILNNIIGFINGMIRAMVGGLNAIISSTNKLGGIFPGFSTMQLLSAPQVPYLASGAVIQPNAPFLAMLGDQRNGKNIETPEGLLRQIVAEELGKQTVNINFTGSLSGLAKVLKPVMEKENVRIGNNLVKRNGAVQIS